MLDHRKFLEIALDQAELAGREGSTPVGAVIVDRDGEIVSVDRNRMVPLGDPTAHAEVMAVRTAGARLMPAPEPTFVLYSSGEPCLMCLGLVRNAPIATVVWAAGPIVVAGSAYDALAASGFSPTRFAALDVIREPVPDLRLRSRKVLHDFFETRDPARAAILAD
jgi:tRNA(adenine34) deaminase